MCQFFSGIVLKTGELLYLDGVDSHEDILSHYKIPDISINSNFCRVEFVPRYRPWDLKDYTFKIDQEKPSWWNDKIELKTIRKIKLVINKYIVKKDVDILPTGIFILSPDIIIDNAGYSTIKHAGSAIINYAASATIVNGGTATIKNARSSTINYAGKATIEYAGSATIKNAEQATIISAGSAIIENAGSAAIRYGATSIIRNAKTATIKYAGKCIIKYAKSCVIENAESATIINK
jgi:hypothetical protein